MKLSADLEGAEEKEKLLLRNLTQKSWRRVGRGSQECSKPFLQKPMDEMIYSAWWLDPRAYNSRIWRASRTGPGHPRGGCVPGATPRHGAPAVLPASLPSARLAGARLSLPLASTRLLGSPAGVATASSSPWPPLSPLLQSRAHTLPLSRWRRRGCPWHQTRRNKPLARLEEPQWVRTENPAPLFWVALQQLVARKAPTERARTGGRWSQAETPGAGLRSTGGVCKWLRLLRWQPYTLTLDRMEACQRVLPTDGHPNMVPSQERGHDQGPQ
ncbi:uncharacterized protein LOC131478310 [Ochotona princeps]|uniref:uncharacterized protein LOC131478310 n=1 Tax=Ochotona princeps TaxID=9978 RepID=UPI0027153045|nr:uncharacterized protein LOC131478310 [Ochotona princeps]